MATTLQQQFGNLDIYVFDLLLRGLIAPGMRVLDAGCGGGRNIQYLLREGYQVFGIDRSEEAIAAVRAMAAQLAPHLPPANFQVGEVDAMPFDEGFADVVLCHSVLHFARDDEHFAGMLRELWRVLRPGGLLFVRLGSRIGQQFEPLGGGRYRLPSGVEWYLVDEAQLHAWTADLGGELVDRVKTTLITGLRSMTTWVVRKPL
ncbi:MAG: class I SAM-dependent methyltransferase [Acidobacteriota bacterium]|nr:class I SAM-dependent methyltransferase [Acidobacteriota bacterium]